MRLNYGTDVTSAVGQVVGPSLAGERFTIERVTVHPDGTSTAHLRHAVRSDAPLRLARPGELEAAR